MSSSSTSAAVPGRGGKGIVDIAVLMADLPEARDALETAGYEFRETASTPRRLFFRRDCPEGDCMRRVHVHVTDAEFDAMIRFRDFLRTHPSAAREYEDIKKEAVRAAEGDGAIYRKRKEAFILDALRRTVLGSGASHTLRD